MERARRLFRRCLHGHGDQEIPRSAVAREHLQGAAIRMGHQSFARLPQAHQLTGRRHGSQRLEQHIAAMRARLKHVGELLPVVLTPTEI